MTAPNTDDGGEHPVVPWLTQRRRAWLYRISSPATALLTWYGIIDGNTAALWTALGVAVVGTGTAALHTSTRV